MANPDDVTVRVEVVINGVIRAQTPRPRKYVPYIIHNPSSTPVTVRQSGGVNYISANGEKASPSTGGAPRVVWAKVYPRTDLVLTGVDFKRPDVDSLSVTPATDGSWAFNAANGKELPGVVCQAAGSGMSGVNNTLVVWYDFTDEDEYILEHVRFLALCPGSGSGVGDSVGTLVFGLNIANALYATFTGALSLLGTVPLAWDGTAWRGAFGGAGGGQLTFSCSQAGFGLSSLGYGPVFALPQTPADQATPFVWSGMGMVLGGCAGPFGVTIVE